jgi:hypothetical protein
MACNCGGPETCNECRVERSERRLTFNRYPAPLPKSRLITGAYYVGVCRNANIARWDGTQFYHWRKKWGSRFVETIRHREDDAAFDVFDAWMCVDASEVNAIPVKGLDG